MLLWSALRPRTSCLYLSLVDCHFLNSVYWPLHTSIFVHRIENRLRTNTIGRHVLFGGHWYPKFWISGDVSSNVSKSEWVLPNALFFAEANVMYILWDPPLVLHMPNSASTASHFPTCISRGGSWLGIKWAITRTEEERATSVPATRILPLSSIVRCQFVQNIGSVNAPQQIWQMDHKMDHMFIIWNDCQVKMKH